MLKFILGRFHQRLILAVLFFTVMNCYLTLSTYEKIVPYPKNENVSLDKIEKLYLDPNYTMKVYLENKSDCVRVRRGSSYIHFKIDSNDRGCESFQANYQIEGIQTLKEIMNSAILEDDKIILDFSEFPKEKFKNVNSLVVWGASDPAFVGYVNEVRIKNEFIGANIANDYKFLFIEKKGITFVFDTHSEERVIRRITIESAVRKIISAYKRKQTPIPFFQVNENGLLVITDFKNRKFYSFEEKSFFENKIIDMDLDLSKEKSLGINYKKIPLIPLALIGDTLLLPLSIPYTIMMAIFWSHAK